MYYVRKSIYLVQHTDEELCAVFIQLIIFACMVAITTTFALVCHDSSYYHFNEQINSIFLERYTKSLQADIQYANIVTAREWWSFIEQIVLTNIYDESESVSNLENRKFLVENLYLGVPRLRQIRVKEQSCYIHDDFNRYFNDCYAEYKESIELRQNEFKGTRFYTKSNLPIKPIKGKTNTYIGPGYVAFLTFNEEANEKIVAKLKNATWIDRGTRVVVVEFVLANINLDIFNNVKFITEVLPTGSILTSSTKQILPIHSIWSPADPIKLIISIAFCSLILFYTINECTTFIKEGAYPYFTRKWNYVDLLILITAYIALAISVLHPFMIEKHLRMLTANSDHGIFLDEWCYWYWVMTFSIGICAVAVWLRLFNYISFNRTMLRFNMTLRKSARDILGFAFMFFIVFISFALLGMLLFGDSNPGFSNFQSSFFTMMCMVMGDFQYQQMEKANPILGPLFFMSYIIFVFFILINMFLAIISDTYVAVGDEIREERSIVRKVYRIVLAKLRSLCGKKEKKLHPSLVGKAKKATFDPSVPRVMRKSEAIQEYFTPKPKENDKTVKITDAVRDTTSSEVSEENSVEPLAQSREEKLTNLILRVEYLEVELEGIMKRFERVLNKFETKVHEERQKKK